MRCVVDVDDLSKEEIEELVAKAQEIRAAWESRSFLPPRELSNVSVANVFLEPSTRTRVSFEQAEHLLKMNVLNFDVSTSSLQKGESLADTFRTLKELGVSLVVVRSGHVGLSRYIWDRCGVSVINAGEGAYAHPTQVLGDIFVLLEEFGSLKGKVVVIVGDVVHSRVARSFIKLFKTFGGEVRVFTLPSLNFADPLALGVETFSSFEEALDGADFVLGLRVQRERLGEQLFPSLKEYSKILRVEERHLASAIYLHPAPVNRGVEVSYHIIDTERSRVFHQMYYGRFMRAALIGRVLEVW